MSKCLFCHYNENEVILRNEHVLFLQQEQDVLIGSGIIIPIKHRETVFDLSYEEWNATYDLLQKVKQYLDKSYQPNGYNVGWNVLPVGGQEIMHAHLHVIPRFKEELYANKGIRHLIKQNENKHR